MTQPASRLITLISLLQRRPNQKAADLALELGISVRSLHRYMEKLDEMGIPIYAERGPSGGFSLVRGYKLPPLVFSPEEAVVLTLGARLVEEVWGKLYFDASHSVRAKLENLLPESQRQEAAWAGRAVVSSALRRPHLDTLAPLLLKLRQAARDCTQVRMEYHNPTKTSPTSRLLDPYALVHRSGWWYVVGYCHNRRDVRTFRLDRITSLELLDQHFDPQPGFDIDEYLSREMEPSGGMTMRMLFSPAMAQVARDNFHIWQKLDEQPDGSVIVSMPVPDLGWAAGMALSFGPDVTVLEPPEVRQEVRRWAQSILERYS